MIKITTQITFRRFLQLRKYETDAIGMLAREIENLPTYAKAGQPCKSGVSRLKRYEDWHHYFSENTDFRTEYNILYAIQKAWMQYYEYLLSVVEYIGY